MTWPCTIVRVRTKTDLTRICIRSKALTGWLWSHCHFLPFLHENTVAQRGRETHSKPYRRKGKSRPECQHLLDTKPWTRQRCKNHPWEAPLPRLPGRSRWPGPSYVQVRCIVVWEALSSLSLRSVRFFFVLWPMLPLESFLHQVCSWNTSDLGNQSGFPHHHAKFAANTSSIPAYCTLLFKTYFSMICQQRGNPDSIV